MHSFDFIVIGAGMAGASAAYNLAPHGRVLVLERESQPGYHSTGRSAALFTECYGSAGIRALTVASRAFYQAPPSGFSDVPLVKRRGCLYPARHDQLAALEAQYKESSRFVGNLKRLDAAAMRAMVPVLRDGYFAAGFLEPDAADIDVAALLQAYLRGMRQHGGQLINDVTIKAITYKQGQWVVDLETESVAAPVIINATGAWADETAHLAGVAPLGLVPKRRTAVTFDVPEPSAIEQWPAVIVEAGETFYFKPDAGRILASPADETPSGPCDAQPEEIDVATVMDRVAQATIFAPKRLAAKWAGLRSFVSDKMIVAGFDPKAEGFFWLAGHGGYGIQTAPAMGRAVGALARGEALPSDLIDGGVTAADLSPARAGLRTA
ncbi:MAG TPA: FAD-dependent oxidoreductase [Magnetospirillaceae bacterium]|jgi:D-arginine dehydrogenase